MNNTFEFIGKLPYENLVKALYLGYEIEYTPEENIRRAYQKYEKTWYQAHNTLERERNHLVCQGPRN